MNQRIDWIISLWMILFIPFLFFIVSCGGGGGNGSAFDTGAIDDSADNSPNTVVESASVLIIPDEYPASPNVQVPTKKNSEMKIKFIKGSNTWPAGYIRTCLEGCNYISETDDPLGPWYGESVNFKGIDAGGKKLIYYYKVKFQKNVEISSIEISGDLWGAFRLLDHAKRELYRFDMSDFSGNETLTMHTYGSKGKIFYLEEIDDMHPEFRYRSNIKVNYSQACASQADIVLNGSDFSDISNVIIYDDVSGVGWNVEGNSIWSFWDYMPFEGAPPMWVEYKTYLTEGKWIIGLCAINHKVFANSEGLGPNPTDRYPYFEISTSLSDEIIKIPASDTSLNSGHFNLDIPEEEEGWYTVRFWWLNDFYLDEKTNIFDANIKIARVFFDLIDDDDGDRGDDENDGDDDGDDDDDGDRGDDDDDDDDDDDSIWADQNPVLITEDNVKIYLREGNYTKNLTINGNNFALIGEAGNECGDNYWSELSGRVTINGNNTIFRNMELTGEIDEHGNNIIFNNVCY